MAYKDLTFLLFAKDMSASRGFERVAHAADKSALGIGASMGVLGVAVAGAAIAVGAESTKMAANFETATTRLVTDAGESQSNLGKVSDGILDISTEVGTAATDIAKGMYYVESAGYHGAAGLEVMRAAAEGAKVGGADLTTVADALTTVMKDYGISSGQANNTTSELIATVSRGKTTMEDLAGSLHSVLPNAQALKIPLNDVLGALATMTQEGISADQATQNLNHTIVSLANPTHVQATEMAAMGLNATEVAKNLGKRGLTGTLDDLVAAITQHMGPGGLVLQKAFNDSALAAQSANTMYKNLPSTVQALAEEYRKGSITQKDWTTDVKAMTPAQANLAKQWAASENASKGFSNVLKSGSGDAQTFTAALAKMTGGQTGLQVALHITGLHAHDTAENVKEIGAAARGTQKNVSDWEKIQGTTNQKLAQASATTGKLGIEIGKGLLPVVGAAATGVSHLENAFIDFSGELSTVHRNIEVFLVKGLVTAVGEIRQVPAQMGKIASDIVSGLTAGIQGHIGEVVGAAERLAGAIPAAVRSLLHINSPSRVMIPIGHGVGEGLEVGLESSKARVISASTQLARSITSAFNHKDISKDVEDSALNLLERDTKRLETIASKRENLADRLKNAKSRLDDAVKTRNDYASTVRSSVVGLGAITSAKGDTVELEDGSTDTLPVTAANETAQLQAALNAAKKMQADLAALKGLGLRKTEYDQLVQQYQSTGDTSYADALLAGGKSAVHQVNLLQDQLASVAKSLGVTTSQTMYQAGVDSAQGIVDGLNSHTKHMKQAADHLADELVKELKKKLGIHSPSRVFHDEVGVNIALGIAGGITAKTKDVNAALTGAVGVPSVNAGSPATGGRGRGNLFIEHYHAAPNQSEAEIASQLGWQMGQY